LKLQQYKFTIPYIKGKHNTVADYLSRSPPDNASNDEDDYVPTKSQTTQTEASMITPIIAPVITRTQARQQQENERNDDHLTNQSWNEQQSKRNVESLIDRSCVPDPKHQRMNITKDQIIPFTYEQLKELQHQNEETKYMITQIEDFNDFFIQDNMLMTKSFPQVPFVPKGRIRSDIIKIDHDTPANGAHFGRDKTIHKIQQRYYWPNMISDIRNHINSRLPCLQK
jgi:hypothetical protein